MDLLVLHSLCAIEVGKLQQHLGLLREQYVKLQERYTSLEQQHAIATASSQATEGEDSFVTRLLRFVADLYDKVRFHRNTVHMLKFSPKDLIHIDNKCC